MIMDGKELAGKILEGIFDKSDMYTAKYGRRPCLAVIQVGNNPASDIYVSNKVKACAKAGIISKVVKAPEDVDANDLIVCIHDLNTDEGVDGIMMQLPLPSHLKADDIVECIDPAKDVDGLTKNSKFNPCTPKGIVRLLDEYGIEIDGSTVTIIGRSKLVGKPLFEMLTDRNATVTLCHSHTKDLKLHTRRSDIVVVAAGIPELIDADSIKKDSVVIDVGINRIGNKIVGDCSSDIVEKAYAYTPVPGGVGPMTVAMLIENTAISMEVNKNGRT